MEEGRGSEIIPCFHPPALLPRKVNRGFPRNLAVESMLERKAREFDAEKEKVEGKLARLLDHRRRLLRILEASQVGDAHGVEQKKIAVRYPSLATF